MEKNPIAECNKILKEILSRVVLLNFLGVNDPRNQSYIDYPVRVMLGTMYYKCIGGISKRLLLYQ